MVASVLEDGGIVVRCLEERGTMRRKITILLVVVFASIFGGGACSGEVQVDVPDEIPAQVQEGD
jgi:hypothetical protein